VSAEIWTFILIGISFSVYLGIGIWSRVKESSGFYVAGRGVPAIANGAATAADWMSAASFIGMAGLISAKGADGSVYLMGWTGGYVLLALLLAPYLRKFGKFTVPDFVDERFDSKFARVVAALCAIVISLTYIAGQMRGIGIVFGRYMQVEIWQGVLIGMVIVGFFALIGGMKGITWTQVVQYFVLILAFLIPAIALSSRMTGNPIPQVGLVTGDAVGTLNELYAEMGFDRYTNSFNRLSNWSMLNVFAITLALMIGTAGLPHVIVRFYTTPTVKAARYSAFWALLFIAILYTTAPAVAVFSRTNVIQQFRGQSLAEVQAIPWVEKWAATGELKFVDKNGDGLVQMGPGNAFVMNGKKPAIEDGKAVADTSNDNEVYISNDIAVLSMPEVGGLPNIVIALVAAGGLAAALSTAAGLLLVISSSVAHDLYIEFFDKHASEPRRVLVGRLMVVAAIGVAGFVGINPPGFVAEVVAFAFGLAAASFFPVLFLGIFSKRVNRQGVVAGMLTGISFTAIYIVCEKFLNVDFKSMFGDFYIASEGIGVIGCLLNFTITLTVSRMFPPPGEEIVALVERVRSPDE